MSTFFIFFLTSILLGICAFTVLLILMQRPSEESGMGATLGGGAATSVFGGEAVNVLAKITKYCTIIFFTLSFILSLLHLALEKADRPKNLLEKRAVVEGEAAAEDSEAAERTQATEGFKAAETAEEIFTKEAAVVPKDLTAAAGDSEAAERTQTTEGSKAAETAEEIFTKEAAVAPKDLTATAEDSEVTESL
jgi:preprotein translocase subunit SecG